MAGGAPTSSAVVNKKIGSAKIVTLVKFDKIYISGSSISGVIRCRVIRDKAIVVVSFSDELCEEGAKSDAGSMLSTDFLVLDEKKEPNTISVIGMEAFPAQFKVFLNSLTPLSQCWSGGIQAITIDSTEAINGGFKKNVNALMNLITPQSTLDVFARLIRILLLLVCCSSFGSDDMTFFGANEDIASLSSPV